MHLVGWATRDMLTISGKHERSTMGVGIAHEVVFFRHRLLGRVYACFKEPQLWVDLVKFFEKACSLQFEDTDKQKIYETISFKEVHREATQLKELTGLLNAPVVFAHNDLLSQNLMLNDEQEKPYIIDFEYGSYNYRGFDIGNYFNEYAGYDCDYSLYPSKDEQCQIFSHYLQPEKPYEIRVSENDLEALYVEANTFMLASHIFWPLWAIIQARMSPIDFDYIEYFFSRYNEYKKQKEIPLQNLTEEHKILSVSHE
ncbi:putative ethanolamine kinase [Hibiscus syriacus]|uniref:ethanolamine kinase n=1 Tax=Hibiscus syriacus TaxID=106335 RepID=A0A6A2WEK9_HIBSY|nr:putative ethanolamine kinase [Hibiscus syriacus]